MSAEILLRTVESTGSTNDDLREALTTPSGYLDPDAAQTWPHLSALRAVRQSAGRGRADHQWTTPPQGALTISFVLRPLVATERLAWLPLLAGLAACEAVAASLDGSGTGWVARTKWPNDVVVLPSDADCGPVEAEELPGWGRSRKVAGVLTELVLPAVPLAPGLCPTDRLQAPGVVVGVGVNVGQGAEDLPVPWATSLTLLGASTTPERAVSDLGESLARLVARWEALGGDPDAGDGSLGRALRSTCSTLGQRVSVQTSSGRAEGLATDLEPGLVLSRTGDSLTGGRTVISAGDVCLVRRTSAQD